jgi:hypothetical protein
MDRPIDHFNDDPSFPPADDEITPEPRIVESGPIHLQVDLAQALRLLIPPEALAEFVKEWVVKRLTEQAETQRQEGEEQHG